MLSRTPFLALSLNPVERETKHPSATVGTQKRNFTTAVLIKFEGLFNLRCTYTLGASSTTDSTNPSSRSNTASAWRKMWERAASAKPPPAVSILIVSGGSGGKKTKHVTTRGIPRRGGS